jgi:hypothetical protein
MSVVLKSTSLTISMMFYVVFGSLLNLLDHMKYIHAILLQLHSFLHSYEDTFSSQSPADTSLKNQQNLLIFAVVNTYLLDDQVRHRIGNLFKDIFQSYSYIALYALLNKIVSNLSHVPLKQSSISNNLKRKVNYIL